MEATEIFGVHQTSSQMVPEISFRRMPGRGKIGQRVEIEHFRLFATQSFGKQEIWEFKFPYTFN